MDKMREAHISEMQRLKKAINKTTSVYLKSDYEKAYKNMARELSEYDRYRNQGKSGNRTKANK